MLAKALGRNVVRSAGVAKSRFSSSIDYACDQARENETSEFDASLDYSLNDKVGSEKDGELERVVGVFLHDLTSLETAAREMEAVARLKKSANDPVVHFVMSYDTERGEQPTSLQMQDDVERLLRERGFTDSKKHLGGVRGKATAEQKAARQKLKRSGELNQYVAVVHGDKAHIHIHVIVNRVARNGIGNDDYQDRIINERTCAKIAQERGWEVVAGKFNEKELLEQAKERGATSREIVALQHHAAATLNRLRENEGTRGRETAAERAGRKEGRHFRNTEFAATYGPIIRDAYERSDSYMTFVAACRDAGVVVKFRTVPGKASELYHRMSFATLDDGAGESGTKIGVAAKDVLAKFPEAYAPKSAPLKQRELAQQSSKLTPEQFAGKYGQAIREAFEHSNSYVEFSAACSGAGVQIKLREEIGVSGKTYHRLSFATLEGGAEIGGQSGTKVGVPAKAVLIKFKSETAPQASSSRDGPGGVTRGSLSGGAKEGHRERPALSAAGGAQAFAAEGRSDETEQERIVRRVRDQVAVIQAGLRGEMVGLASTPPDRLAFELPVREPPLWPGTGAEWLGQEKQAQERHEPSVGALGSGVTRDGKAAPLADQITTGGQTIALRERSLFDVWREGRDDRNRVQQLLAVESAIEGRGVAALQDHSAQIDVKKRMSIDANIAWRESGVTRIINAYERIAERIGVFEQRGGVRWLRNLRNKRHAKIAAQQFEVSKIVQRDIALRKALARIKDEKIRVEYDMRDAPDWRRAQLVDKVAMLDKKAEYAVVRDVALVADTERRATLLRRARRDADRKISLALAGADMKRDFKISFAPSGRDGWQVKKAARSECAGAKKALFERLNEEWEVTKRQIAATKVVPKKFEEWLKAQPATDSTQAARRHLDRIVAFAAKKERTVRGGSASGFDFVAAQEAARKEFEKSKKEQIAAKRQQERNQKAASEENIKTEVKYQQKRLSLEIERLMKRTRDQEKGRGR